jgi:hypothetical protein
MDDPERRLRQLLARHIQNRAEAAAREPLARGACYQLIALVRLWQAGGGDWDQLEPFGHFELLMSDVECAVIPVSDEELIAGARAVGEAARTLS